MTDLLQSLVLGCSIGGIIALTAHVVLLMRRVAALEEWRLRAIETNRANPYKREDAP